MSQFVMVGTGLEAEKCRTGNLIFSFLFPIPDHMHSYGGKF